VLNGFVTRPSFVFERPTPHRLGRALRSPTWLRWFGLQPLTQDFPPKRLDQAAGFSPPCSRSHRAVIRVYDQTGNVIETHEHKGDFKEP
jgi:hypothetical protein